MIVIATIIIGGVIPVPTVGRTTVAPDYPKKSQKRQQTSSYPPSLILPGIIRFFGHAQLSMPFPDICHASETLCQI